jgi:hypothetical protein
MIQDSQNKDEISLMDIALIIAKRFKSTCASFLIAFALLSALVIQYERDYSLTSIIQIGSFDTDNPIESPEAVSLRLQQGILPQILSKLEKEGAIDPEAFIVNISNPSKTKIIVIDSKIKKSTEEKYTIIHSKLVETIVNQHAKEVDERTGFIKSQLADNINHLRDEDSKTANLQHATSQLAAITQTKAQVIAQRSQFQSGPKHSKLYIAAVFLSLILALITPLCIEFYVQIKLRLANEQ